MRGRLAGVLLVALAISLDADAARAALAQTWPPFVLVTGLLLIGLIVGSEGLFDDLAARLMRLPGPPLALLLVSAALVAVVTALLNLDTAVVFLTPVLIAVARRRALDPRPFLYASVFMANASSLFLPGSNLTNLLVLSGHPVSGARFLAQMLPAALTASLLTAAGLAFIHRRALGAQGKPVAAAARPLRLGAGLAAALLAAALILALRNPAPAVLVLAVCLLLWRARRGVVSIGTSLSAVGLDSLLALFGVTVVLGTLARVSSAPAHALSSASEPVTALVAALASVLVNNLPAAVLLSSRRPPHPDALLLGLNLGPNLAVTGSLAVLLWWRSASACGLEPSARAYSRQGLLLAPLALAGALLFSAG